MNEEDHTPTPCVTPKGKQTQKKLKSYIGCVALWVFFVVLLCFVFKYRIGMQ